MDIHDFEIGNIVRFKHEEAIKVDYYGIVVDKSVIGSEFWIKWFNHEFINSDAVQKYDFESTYSHMWSVVV
jgi:hypothetical protein